MAFVAMQNKTDADTNYFLLARKELENSLLFTESWHVPVVVGCYLALVAAHNSRFFKNQKPMNLKTIMLFYNVYQVLSNFYIFYHGVLPDTLSYLMNNSCNPKDPATNYLWFRGTRMALLFYISKLTDLLDTVFIILRRKSEQVTLLHVYHHGSMVLFTWFALKYYPSEQLVLVMITNSFVHIFMYTYYFLSLLGPSAKKYLWWKNYVTLLQLIQFVIFILHNTMLIVLGCKQPPAASVFVLSQGVLFFKMFKDFYTKTYSSKVTLAAQPDTTEKIKQT